MEANQVTFRNYLFFWSGQLISLLGSSIAQFVIIWWIVDNTGSALYLSLGSLLGLAPVVILSPIAGVLVDRWNRRVLIGIVDLLQALATVGLILMFWMNVATLFQVLILLFLRGVFQAFHSPATSAITPLMVPKEKLSRMNGLSFLFTGAINLAGPVIAAILLEIWLIDSILWIDAFTFIIALIPLLRITIPPVREKLQKTSFREDLVEGLSFIRGRRGLLPTVVMAALLNFLLTPLSTLLPYFVNTDHFGKAPHLAFVIAAGSGGTLGGGLLMSVWKGVKKKILSAIAAIYILFLGYAWIALTPTGVFWFMAIGFLIGSFFVPMANVSIITIIQTVVPARMQGRVNSVLSATAMAAMPIGMILSGTLAEFVATSTIFLGCTVLGVIVITLFWLFTDIRHVEEIEDSPHINTVIEVDSG